ncbi:rapA guanosine triphosphatase-activating protein 1-like [Daktulosphaira vitifoliae]|uniref:rapA guanosine triphosphatase-activating protein 1-like n=1 Tax=Daktulosphaira vitifoliae TaxID=58002 RepID=UPI0021AACBA9|nr:rapA guanosine triphosphatase-activating protein 1-like [Daktulosphaira vitifoliae]
MAEGAGKRPTQPPDRLGIDPPSSPAHEKNERSDKSNQQLRDTLKAKEVTDKKREINLSEMGGMLSELLKGMKARDEDTKRINDDNRKLFTEIQKSLDIQKDLLQSKLFEREKVCAERHDSLVEQIGMLEEKVSSNEESLCILDTRSTFLEDFQKQSSSAMDQLRLDHNALQSKVQQLSAELQKVSKIISVPTNSTVAPTSFITPAPITSSTHLPINLNHTSNFENSRLSVSMLSEKFNDVIPEFSGHVNDIHPELFLSQVDSYFENIICTEQQKINSIQRRLVRTARLWYDALIPSPQSYDEFKVIFRSQFWSEAIQDRVHDEVLRPYRYLSNTGLSIHAMQWIAKARFLDPPISPSRLVKVICQHFNEHICTALKGRAPKTTSELLAVLSEFDNSPSFHSTTGNNNNTRGLSNGSNVEVEQRPENVNYRRHFNNNNNNRRFENNRGRGNDRSRNQSSPGPSPGNGEPGV